MFDALGDLLAAMNDTIVPEVERLIQVCRDGEELFRHASAISTSAHLKTLFEQYAAQRRAFLQDLQREAVAFGERNPIKSGSIAATILRGWKKLRDSMKSPDEQTIVSECESEEDNAVEAYRAAVELTTLPDSLRDVVAKQYTEISSAHQHIKDLRDSFTRS